jgi:mRNA interferase RelE/StbE
LKTYKLEFKESAVKEWKKLDGPIREQFKKKLAERLVNPRIESAQLRHMADCYKIKLRASGYRLVYEVHDSSITVTVVSVGKREDSYVYAIAKKRLTDR